MIDKNCKICYGVGWVCENHSTSVWDDSVEGGCECGAGMPCKCNKYRNLPPDVKIIYKRDIAKS